MGRHVPAGQVKRLQIKMHEQTINYVFNGQVLCTIEVVADQELCNSFSGALQNYACDSLIKDQQTFKELQESQGQRGNVTIPQTFKYYYRNR